MDSALKLAKFLLDQVHEVLGCMYELEDGDYSSRDTGYRKELSNAKSEMQKRERRWIDDVKALRKQLALTMRILTAYRSYKYGNSDKSQMPHSYSRRTVLP